MFGCEFLPPDMPIEDLRHPGVRCEDAMKAYLSGTCSGGDLLLAMKEANMHDKLIAFVGKLHEVMVAQEGELKKLKGPLPIVRKYSFKQGCEDRCTLTINTKVGEMPLTLWRDLSRLSYMSENVFGGQAFRMITANREAAERLLKGALYAEESPKDS